MSRRLRACACGSVLIWSCARGLASAEWIASAYLGAATTRPAALNIIQPAVGTDVRLDSVHYRGEPFTPPLYYGVHLSWFPRESSWLGIDVELIHLKAFARTEQPAVASGRLHGVPVNAPLLVGDLVQRFSISHGLNFLLVNAVVRQPLGSAGLPARLVFTGRLGGGPTIPHAESTIDGRSTEGYEWGSPGWQAAAGLQFRVLRRFDLLGEYKFTRTRQSVNVDQGIAGGVFASHHAAFGLAWHF